MRVIAQVVAMDIAETGPIMSLEGIYTTRVVDRLPQEVTAKVVFVLEPDAEDIDSSHSWHVRGVTPDGNTWDSPTAFYGVPESEPGTPFLCVVSRELAFRARHHGVYEFHLIWDDVDFAYARLELAPPTGR